MAGQPYLTVRVDREKLARYGVNASDVLHVIELGVAGMPVGQVYQENRVFDIAIRFPEAKRQSAEALGSLLIDVPGGYFVALRELADVDDGGGPGADQPRERPAADRHRDERRGPRHRQLRAATRRRELRRRVRAAAGLLPRPGAASSRASSRPCSA